MPMITVILGGKTHYNEGGPFVIGGETAVVDEATLAKREYIIDNDNERTTITEYWLDGELVKRGAHVHLKTGIFAEGILADFGDTN